MMDSPVTMIIVEKILIRIMRAVRPGQAENAGLPR